MMMNEFMLAQPRRVLFLIACALVAFFGALDYLTGPYYFFVGFYLIPIAFAVWYAGRSAGMIITVISAICCFVDEAFWFQAVIQPLLPYWNVAVQFLFLFIFMETFSRLKHIVIRERELETIDHMTLVANRKSFFSLGEKEIARAKRYARPVTVAYVDLDNFKTANDLFGHMVGDDFLKAVAGALQANVRTTDVVGRLGGDEFAIIFPETGHDAAQAVLARVRRDIMSTAQKNGWPLTVSIGAISYERAPASAEEAVRKADDLMLQAKRTGKDAIQHEMSSGGDAREERSA